MVKYSFKIELIAIVVNRFAAATFKGFSCEFFFVFGLLEDE